MENLNLTPQRIFAELSKSTHKDLSAYTDIGKQAITREPEFFAHLIAWNAIHGQVRDSQVALPMLGFAFEKEEEFIDNSEAHIAKLNPRELLKAFSFLRQLRPLGRMQRFDRLVQKYMNQKEGERGWDHMTVTHWKVMRELYAKARVTPTNDRVRAVIFGFKGRGEEKVKLPLPKGSVFEVVRGLKNLSPVEAAGAIMKYKIPFLVAAGALEQKARETDLLVALIGQMTATELTTNVKALEKLGMKTNPAVRGAFDQAMEKAATSKKNTLKTSKAVDAVSDEGLKEKLRGLQDKQIKAARRPEGDWLILADRSPSMRIAIELAKQVAAEVAAFVKGKVHLVFFDAQPTYVDVTGLSLDQISKATRHIREGSATSIGVGLNRMLVDKIPVDGIAIISDGEENTAPLFPDVYRKYCEFAGKDVPVYFFHCQGGGDNLTHRMNAAGLEMQKFDLTHGQTDYYAVPNLVASMRSNQYSLVDEIMSTPLLTLSDVLKDVEQTVGV